MTVIERAQTYVEKIPGATSGGGGHNQTFSVAVALTQGFELAESDAMSVFKSWNNRCDPPWSDADLAHKLKDAAGRPSRKPRGWLKGNSDRCTRPQRTGAVFGRGTDEDILNLSTTRDIGAEGLRWAVRRGILRFGDWFGDRVWALTDQSKRITELRRMDRKPFRHGGKSHTLKGGEKAWPVGILEAESFPCIALFEGGPDLLAGHYQAIWEQLPSHTEPYNEELHIRCAPVGMMSASPRIHAEALAFFKGKHVRIIPHPDENGAGIKGAIRWNAQLIEAGASKVDFVDLSKIQAGADFADLAGQIGDPVLPK